MKLRVYTLLAMSCFALTGMAQNEKLTDYVRPLVGTDGYGNVYPGAQIPFGGIQISPDTDSKYYDAAAGYKYNHTSILGFSLTHLSGTGIPDLGDFLFIPGTGEMKLDPGTRENPDEGYRSRYTHDQEWTSPNYYAVLLQDYGVKAEMTAGLRSGMFRFTYPKSDKSFIMIDLNHTLWQSCEWSNLRMENDSTLTGYKLVKGWGPERHVYFTAVFSKKLKDFRIMQDKKPVIYNTSRFRSTNEAWGKNLMACLSFATEEGEEVIVKTSVSAVSTAGAQLNMQELDGMTFDGLKEKGIDLSRILDTTYVKAKHNIFEPKSVYDFELEKTADMKVLLKKLKPALESGTKRSIEIDVKNTDRAFGTIFGSEITKRYKDTLPEDTFTIKCKGAGGQSFGAFIPKGLTLELVGDSNDYFGKGLSGGKLVVCQPKGVKFKSDENIIIGNVALYGATSGKVFVGGVAGERFAVRNSGARAVVEGVGDHGCEYMTGGCVVVLGQVGKNFAAGMSGGIAYVIDLDNSLYRKVNKAMVNIERVTDKYDVQELKGMIQEHVAYTNSEVGKKILDNFKEYLPKFKKIIPEDYERMMSTIIQMEEKGLSREKAKIEAFNMIKNGR